MVNIHMKLQVSSVCIVDGVGRSEKMNASESRAIFIADFN